MNLQFGVKLQLGYAAQVLLENGCFDLKLVLVIRVLIVAAATTLEVWAPRLDAPGRSFNHLVDSGTGKTRLLFDQGDFDLLAFQDEGHEDSFAPATLVRGKAGQAVAAVHEFFDFKFQDVILQS